jgi:hypothetical protein
MRRAQHLSQEHRASFTIFLKGSRFPLLQAIRRRQPPRVTSRWRFLKESLVPQSSRTLKSSTTILHTHNRSRNACVRKERALKSLVCYWNGQGSHLAWDGWLFIAHTPKSSRWEDCVHLAVRSQYNSWSDRHNSNDYNFEKKSTVGRAGGLTALEPGGLTSPGGDQAALEQRLAVWSDPSGGQNARACLGRPKQLLQWDFLQGISTIQNYTIQGEE